MDRPPHCPNPACLAHANPIGKFWYRSGSYQPKCRREPVPRFRCRHCGRRFSSQTFRADYRDHKPHLNAQVFERLLRGVGQRQTARELGLSRRSAQNKMRKIRRRLAARALTVAEVDRHWAVGDDVSAAWERINAGQRPGVPVLDPPPRSAG